MPTKHTSAKQYRIDNGLPVKSNLSPIKSNLSPIKRPKSEPKSGTPRNKWEQEMFNLLTALVKAKVINGFRYEPYSITLMVKPKASYKPDFLVYTNDMKMIVIETKGYQWEKDKLRFLWASQLNEDMRFVMLTKDKGKWVVKYDLNKGSAELPKEIVNV